MKYKLLPLEKYKNPILDTFFWIKHFYVWRFLDAKLKTENVPDDFDLSALINDMLKQSTNNMDKVIAIVNKASKGIMGVNSSHSTLKPFHEYVSKDKDLHSIIGIDQHYIKNYVVSVNSEEETATKERYYTHLKKLFNFMQDHNIVEGQEEPHKFNIGKDKQGKAEKFFHTRKEKKLPIFLETEEMQILNKRISEKSNPHYKDEVDKATQILIIRLFMFGLISISELQHIKATDFITVDDMSILELKVGDRVIPLPRRKLIGYINTLKASKKCEESEYLFCMGKSLKYISNRVVGDIIKNQFDYAKIKKPKATADVLRNSGTIYLNRRGISDKKLQEIRGDKAILTVQILLKSAVTDHYSTASMFDDLVN
jgi:site-specific recombinase XerD